MDSLGNIIRCSAIKKYGHRPTLQGASAGTFSRMKGSRNIFENPNLPGPNSTISKDAKQSKLEKEAKERDVTEAGTVIQLGLELRNRNLYEAERTLSQRNLSAQENKENNTSIIGNDEYSKPEFNEEMLTAQKEVQDMKEKVAKSLSSMSMFYKHLMEDEAKAAQAHAEALDLFEQIPLGNATATFENLGNSNDSSPGRENVSPRDDDDVLVTSEVEKSLSEHERSDSSELDVYRVQQQNSYFNSSVASGDLAQELENVNDLDSLTGDAELVRMGKEWDSFKRNRLRKALEESTNRSKSIQNDTIDKRTYSMFAAVAAKVANKPDGNDSIIPVSGSTPHSPSTNILSKTSSELNSKQSKGTTCRLVLVDNPQFSSTGGRTITQEEGTDSIPEIIELDPDQADVCNNRKTRRRSKRSWKRS